MFCCGLCSYQSCGKGHLAVHACMMHDVKPAPWYTKCDEKSAVSVEPKDEYKSPIVTKQYVCVTSASCKFRCLTDGALWTHMQQTHRDCSAYVCHLCFVSAETRLLLLEHYYNIHDYHSVECLYCDFGANDNWLVMGHIMDRHPHKPFKMLVRAGNSIDVLHELRNLAASHLTKCAVPPVQLPMQDSSPVQPVPTVQTEQEDSSIPAQPPCTSLQNQDQSCTAGHDEPMCDVSEQTPGTCEPMDESFATNFATSCTVTLPHSDTDKLPFFGVAKGVATSSVTCAQRSSAVGLSCQEPPSPVHSVETSGLTNSRLFVCNIHGCGMQIEEIFDFMNHLAECHPSESSFACPKCGFFVLSSADLLAHLVDKHSGVLFCPYKDCTFGSLHQSGIDSHIIQMHQVYQQDQGNSDSSPADVGAQDESDGWSEPLCSSPNVSHPERLDDTPAPEASPYDKTVADRVQCEGSTENAMDDCKITLHFCSKCSLYFSTAARYIQHMTVAHMVEFFCGYCLKAYKKSRCLFLHTGCQHPGRMLSVKCLRDEKVVDVGPQVLPLWMEDARQYLQKVDNKLFGLRGKSMVQNLKTTLAFMESVFSDLEVRLPDYTATHDQVADHPGQVPATQLSTSCTAQETTLKHMKEQTMEHSLQGQPWSSLVPCERYLTEEHLSDHFSAYKDPAADSVKHQLDVTGRTSLSSEPPFTASSSRRLNLNVRSSAYVDPRYCKKVDGKIVVDEFVLQKLLKLSAASRPISKRSLQEGPLARAETSQDCHQCFKCSLRFASFEALCQHIVLHHKDRVLSPRCTGTLLGGKSQCFTQVFPSDNVNEDIKPIATASWHNSSVQAESSTSDQICKEVQLKTRECSSDDPKLFVRLVSGNVRVPYSQLARFMNVNPVVKLHKLPTIKS